MGGGQTDSWQGLKTFYLQTALPPLFVNVYNYQNVKENSVIIPIRLMFPQAR